MEYLWYKPYIERIGGRKESIHFKKYSVGTFTGMTVHMTFSRVILLMTCRYTTSTNTSILPRVHNGGGGGYVLLILHIAHIIMGGHPELITCVSSHFFSFYLAEYWSGSCRTCRTACYGPGPLYVCIPRCAITGSCCVQSPAHACLSGYWPDAAEHITA